MKVLMILGGFRIGDTFHLLPLIDSLKEDEITWVTGTYEKPAVELIQKYHSQIKQVVYVDDNTPTDFNSRTYFVKDYKDKLDRLLFDRIIEDPGISVEWGYRPERLPKIKEGSYFPVEPGQDYICTHSKSISEWKNRDLLAGIKYPLPTKSLDGLTSMEEAFSIVNKSRFLVGIHSSMACLAIYCNKPLICYGSGEHQLNFSSLRPHSIDIQGVDPTRLNAALDLMMEKTKI